MLASLALLAMLGGCGKSAEEKYARAQTAFSQHDYAASRLDLISALVDDPQNKAMLELLAKTQLALGDGEGAAASLSALGGAGNNGGLAILMAEANVLRGRYDEALAVLSGINQAEAARITGLAHLGKGDAAAARKAFEAGLGKPGPKARLQAAYARLELGSGRTVAAKKLADMAAAASPAPLEAVLVSAEVAVAQNNLRQALATYDKALSAYPANFAASLGKVGVLGDLGRIDDADKLLQTIAADAPDNAKIIYLQARIAAARNQWSAARTILQAQEPLMEENPSMQVVYAESLLQIGQVEQARAKLVPLLRKYPANRKIRFLLGEAQVAGKEFAGALASLTPLTNRPDARPEELALAARAAKGAGDGAYADLARRAKVPAPEWLGGQLATGDAALRNGDWAAASRSYQSIVDRTAVPGAMVLNNLAYAKSRMGQTDEAVALALKALEAMPGNPSIMDTAGWLLVDTGKDRKRGIALLQAAAQKAPDNAAIARHLAAAQSR